MESVDMEVPAFVVSGLNGLQGFYALVVECPEAMLV